MYEQILVPIDGSATARRGLDEAIRLARFTGARLRLLHVVDELTYTNTWNAEPSRSGDWRERAFAEASKVLEMAGRHVIDARLEAQTMLQDIREGSVSELIVREANRWPASLIVIGTHGRRGVGRMLLGSTAEQVLRHATQPVLLVRAAETPAEAAVHDGVRHIHQPSGALSIE